MAITKAEIKDWLDTEFPDIDTLNKTPEDKLEILKLILLANS